MAVFPPPRTTTGRSPLKGASTSIKARRLDNGPSTRHKTMSGSLSASRLDRFGPLA